MTIWQALPLIFGTWFVAIALMPWVVRSDGVLRLCLANSVGCSGSIVAVVLANA